MESDAFLKHIDDVYRLCEKYHTPRFSEFLDAAQQVRIKPHIQNTDGLLFGGYSGAERCMLGVFPPWCDADNEEFPIKILEFTKKYDREISHRNYLGTILSLGIKRGKIGDILTHDKGCYVFISSDIAEFVRDNISKVSGCGVGIEITDLSRIHIPEKKFELIETVAASQRLDAVLAAAAGISRNEAKNMILSGKVSVNHCENCRTDYAVKTGDLLSVRGFGRVRLETADGKTRSGRLHITLKKFI